MKRIVIFVLAVASLSACTFVRIDTKALKALIETGDVEITSDKPEVIRAKGDVKTEVKRNLPEFFDIESNLAADIVYTAGEQYLEISAPESILPYISSEVVEGKLVLKVKGVRVRNASDITVIVRTPKIRHIEINGAGDIEMNGHMETDEFGVTINGAGDLDIDDIKADNVEIEVNGAGDIEVEKAVCESFRASVHGAGDLDVESLEAKDVTVSLEGAGSCELAGHTVNADLSVSGVGTIDITALEVEHDKSNTSGFAKIIR